MKKQTKKILKILGIGWVIISVVLTFFYFFGFIKSNYTKDDGLSIQLYDSNGLLIKEIKPFTTIDVGGQKIENVGFIKLKYKVTNNGNIPLTIKVIESNPVTTWYPLSQLVEVNNSVIFESQLIDLSQLTSLQQPVSFIVKAQGESLQLTSVSYPTTSDLIQATITVDVVSIIANIEGDLSLATESCKANRDYGSQQQEIETYCNINLIKSTCESCDSGSSACEFCAWK